MVEDVDKERLDKVLQLLQESKIRFPVAETVKRTGYTKGQVSNILRGEIPMSQNFYDTFLEKFQQSKKRTIKIKDADLGKVVSNLIEITIKQQAQINLLTKAFDSVSAKAVQKEYDRLYDEYLDQQ